MSIFDRAASLRGCHLRSDGGHSRQALSIIRARSATEAFARCAWYSHAVAEEVLLELHKQIARRNGSKMGSSTANFPSVQDRDFVFPETMEPTFVMFTQKKKVLDNPKWKTGLSVKTVLRADGPTGRSRPCSFSIRRFARQKPTGNL